MIHRRAVTICLLALAASLAEAGCGSSPPEDTGTTDAEQALGGQTCASVAVASGGAAALAVQLGSVTAGCASGMLAVAALSGGLAETVCVVPAGATALAALAAALTSGAAFLVCRNAEGADVEQGSVALKYPNQRCSNGDLDDLVRRQHRFCDMPFSCDGITDCRELAHRTLVAEACADARLDVMSTCFDGGDDPHKREVENVRAAQRKCLERMRACRQ